MAHCMIRSGALHPFDNNKVSLLIGGYKRFMAHLKPYDKVGAWYVKGWPPLLQTNVNTRAHAHTHTLREMTIEGKIQPPKERCDRPDSKGLSKKT